MNLDEYRSCDATALAELIRTKDISPSEAVNAALSAIAADPELNAVVNLMDEQAHRSIAAGIPDGPFQGVPFLIKDLGANVAGTVTTNGCRLFADAPAATGDSEVVRRYRAAGLVIVGKTNTPEFGLAPSTEPALFGPTRNPHSRDRSAGGSSGGAAAAVAAGLTPAAHASDGGGSIRIPSSCCGLFGLKPTRGRVSYGPERGEGWAGMSTQHAVTRSVRDSAALLDVSAGPAPGDPYWPPLPERPFSNDVRVDPRPLRVGLVVTSPTGIDVDAHCRQSAERTARRLEDLGHRVDHVSWPMPAELLAAAQGGIAGANVSSAIQSRLADLDRPLADDDLEPVTAVIVDWGRRSSAVDYVNAVNAMHEVGRRMAELFATIDVLVTPTMGCLPPVLGQVNGTDMDRFIVAVGPMAAFTALANMSGQPAMSLPLDWADGLPIGTQVIGRYGDESTLLSLAGQIERAHPWVRSPS